MKKIAILLLVIILSFGICACGNSFEKELLGKWVYTEINEDEKLTFTLTFKKSSFEAYISNSKINASEQLEGTYKINEEKNVICLINEHIDVAEITYEYINGELCIKPFEDDSIILKKEK